MNAGYKEMTRSDFAMVGIGTAPIPLSANAATMTAFLSSLGVFHLYLWQIET